MYVCVCVWMYVLCVCVCVCACMYVEHSTVTTRLLNWEGYGVLQSGPVLRYSRCRGYISHGNQSHYSRFPDRYSNPEPPEHEAGCVVTQLRRSARGKDFHTERFYLFGH